MDTYLHLVSRLFVLGDDHLSDQISPCFESYFWSFGGSERVGYRALLGLQLREHEQ